MQRDHGSLTAGQSVLASAQLPDPVIIPPPDVDIDGTYPANENQQDETTWADKGFNNAQSLESTWPQQKGLQPTKANLQYESDSVVATEDKALLKDYIDDFLSRRDPDFAANVCKVLKGMAFLIRVGTLNPNDPSQVASYLVSLKSSTDPSALGAVEEGLNNSVDLFKQAFPQCNSTLDTIQWMIKQFQELLCQAG